MCQQLSGTDWSRTQRVSRDTGMSLRAHGRPWISLFHFWQEFHQSLYQQCSRLGGSMVQPRNRFAGNPLNEHERAKKLSVHGRPPKWSRALCIGGECPPVLASFLFVELLHFLLRVAGSVSQPVCVLKTIVSYYLLYFRMFLPLSTISCSFSITVASQLIYGSSLKMKRWYLTLWKN